MSLNPAESREVTGGLSVARLDARTADATIDFARAAWDRPNDSAYLDWRYREEGPQEASLAMHGGACVGAIFAFRRRYVTPDGERDCLEVFDWYANERWRSRGAGLRVIREFMADGRPLIAFGGTETARAIFERLRWTRLHVGWRFNLPLRGAFFESRGRAAVFGTAFDLTARHFLTPRRAATSISLVPGGGVAAAVDRIAREQRRFAWLRLPDPATDSWLRNAPPSIGLMLRFHIRRGDELIGWASARVYEEGGLRTAAFHELFLADDAVRWYAEAVREFCRVLAGFAPDVITAVTSCPHTIGALRQLHFRRDYDLPIYCWTGGAAPSPAPILADGSHAEWAILPLPTAAESAWLNRR